MKKKIIIMTEKMNMGGVEKALISMLKEFDYSKYNITLLLTAIEGDLLKQVPKEVEIITLKELISIYGFSIKTEILNQLKNKNILTLVYIIYLYYRLKVAQDVHSLYKFICKNMPKINEEYDVAISYQAPSRFPVIFVSDNIIARKKIAWMHNDPMKSPCNLRLYKSTYQKYDKIFCVSENVKNNFISLFPSLKAKTETFYNIIPVKEIQELSLKGVSFEDNYKGVRILTVGRLSPEKGYDLAIEACEQLVNEGYNIRWYVCGEGRERSKLEQLILDKGLSNNFILMGNQSNPYPFIRDCDIYCQPSRFEGYGLSVAEARILKKPIIATCVTGINEQIKNEKNGVLTDIDKNKIYLAIKSLIDDKSKCENLVKNLKLENSDFNQITKLIEFINN